MTAQNVVVLSSAGPSGWAERLGARARTLSLPLDSAELEAIVGNAGCVLVDGECPAPLGLARSAHRADPTVQIAVVIAADQHAALEKSLLFQPGLGELWLVHPDDVGDALAESAAEVTASRRKFKRTRARLEQHAFSIPPPAPPRLSPAHLSGLLEVLPDAVFSTDAAGCVQFANRRASLMLGVPEAEMVGRPLADLLGAEEPDAIRELLESRGRHDGTLELGFRRSDGEHGVGELRITRVEANHRHTHVAVLHDATTEHRARAELAAAQSRLVAADRLASLGAMAAAVGHEINNPLAYVIPHLELASDQVAKLDSLAVPSVTELAESIAAAREGTERIRKVVANLKSFARGNEPHERRPVALEGVLDAALRMTQNQLAHRARVERDFRPAPRVLADEAELVQVFVNLLLNAAQATPAGQSAANVVRVALAGSPEGQAIVEVSDTGTGMSSEVQARIFEPFFTTKPVGEGTGLGLPVSQGIVARHGGTIRVSSVPLRGTTFTVTLPGERSDERLALPIASTSAPPATARARVLLVDDDPRVLRALARVLAREHDVVEAASGAEALARIDAGGRFDLILCDLMMPQMSGAEVFRRLLQTAPDQAERLVIMTGGAFSRENQHFLENEARRWIQKPCGVNELRALASEAVQKLSKDS